MPCPYNTNEACRVRQLDRPFMPKEALWADAPYHTNKACRVRQLDRPFMPRETLWADAPYNTYQFIFIGGILKLGFLIFLNSSCRACSGFWPFGI